MADSRRQDIIDAINTQFAKIRTANGYKTNIGASVREWQTTPIPVDVLPAICFRDGDNEIEASAFDKSFNRVILVIEAFGKDVSAATVRTYVEDIYKAVGADETWGGLALETQPLGDTINMETEEEGVGRATVRISILYETTKWVF